MTMRNSSHNKLDIFVISEFLQENNWRAFEIERSKFEKYTNDLQKIIVIVKDVSVRSISIELDKILRCSENDKRNQTSNTNTKPENTVTIAEMFVKSIVNFHHFYFSAIT
jgi:hypothetical protein